MCVSSSRSVELRRYDLEDRNVRKPEDIESLTLTLTATGNVTLQTYGFGGGTNAAGTLISPGGFDPFVGLFAGTGLAATLINGTSDVLSNYAAGCPPAGTMTVGSVKNQCGDVRLQFNGLAAGIYTVVLTDGEYIPNAVFEPTPGPLGDGFSDLTAGVFQTCEDANNCNTDTGAWALDITTAGRLVSTPEPAGTALLSLAVSVLALRRHFRIRAGSVSALKTGSCGANWSSSAIKIYNPRYRKGEQKWVRHSLQATQPLA